MFLQEHFIMFTGKNMFKYFLHYNKTTGELIGYDKASDRVSKKDFGKGILDWQTVEVTEAIFEEESEKIEKEKWKN